MSVALLAASLIASAGCLNPRSDRMIGFRPLFPDEGVPKGWVVRAWDDIRNPAKDSPVWRVKDGVLRGGEPRGSWLMSEETFSNFILDYEFKLGERGNSGCALRVPLAGDPAFDGIELQMADFRYNPAAKDSELTGGFYRAIPPKKQVYKPTEWNHYRVECRGSRLRVELNGELIQDIRMEDHAEPVVRHNGAAAPPIKDRPRSGHIGFQELSREGGPVQIRNARIKLLPN